MQHQRRLSKAEARKQFLCLVEGIVSDFTPHPDEPRVGVPRRFTPLYPLAKFLKKKIDPLLRSVSYPLFQFSWWSVPGSTFTQDIAAILLPDRTRVFWFWLEADDDVERQFYVAGTASPVVTDLQFLQLLFKENGRVFGVEVCGAAPNEIITSLEVTPELVNMFVDAYNGFPQAWDSLDDYQPQGRFLNRTDPAQARELVQRHLRAVTHLPHRALMEAILVDQGGGGGTPSDLSCPFCDTRYSTDEPHYCEHLVAEGDPEGQMFYHWDLLNELMELVGEAIDLEIDLTPLGRGVRGWNVVMQGDERDVLPGDFLRTTTGFRTISVNTQSIGPMSGIYFWVFVSPRSRKAVEREFTVLRDRLREAIREEKE